MAFLYGFLIRCYGLLLWAASLTGNRKAKLWVEGRKGWRKRLRSATQGGHQWVWFHCASLGEFEQGRPVMEGYRQRHPDRKILLTFFSPSGYTIRKDYAGADFVCYLPLDTASNARDLVSIVNPTCVFFIKYEFWFNLLQELKQRQVSVYMVSGIFRHGHWLFKPWGTPFRKRLNAFTHFFVQDETSAKQLLAHELGPVSVSGDTRFDRVATVSKQAASVPLIEKWCQGKQLIVAGSTWPEDESALLKAFPKLPADTRLLLVPHETDLNHLRIIESTTKSYCPEKSLRFLSQWQGEELTDILVVDRIGLLSTLYRYAAVTYIGGGFGKGIHNTLEAAVYGKPVVFGPNFKKFQEAIGLITAGAGYSCPDSQSIGSTILNLLQNRGLAAQSGEAALRYVREHTGATTSILDAV